MPKTSYVKKVTAGTVTVQTLFTYDYMYRPGTIKQSYNGGAYLSVGVYNYNELGQLIRKNLGQFATGTIPAVQDVTGNLTGANTIIATNQITIHDLTMSPGATLNAFISTGALQTVDYRYNIRGQLLSINNSKLGNDGGLTNSDNTDLFGMQFLYDQQDANLANHPYFSGKLSAVKWMSKDGSGSSSYERAYLYGYDGLGRDTAAIYAERATAFTGAFSVTHGWDENRISYDQNGNLLTLYRNFASAGAGNHTPMDNLAYTYDVNNPNQLKSVTDATGNSAGFIGGTGNYAYDVNGNLVSDPYKGITHISYNVLNRTDTLKLSATQYITYTYDAGGSLLRKQAYKSGAATMVTDYIDGFVYNNTSGSEILGYFPMPEGRVRNDGGALHQEFIIADQQGNARISFQDNGTGSAVVRQENSYYSFGMVMPNSPVGTLSDGNRNLYNGGSEWQNDYSNLPDYYQTFYRNYDAALGRFVGVDPEAESAESMTGYQYAGNNPVMFNDPLGNMKKAPQDDPMSYNLPPGGGPGYMWAIDGGDDHGDAYQEMVSPLGEGSYSGSSSYWDSVLAGTGLRYINGNIYGNANSSPGSTAIDLNNLIAPYSDHDVNFSSNGSILSDKYDASNGSGIVAKQEGVGALSLPAFVGILLNNYDMANQGQDILRDGSQDVDSRTLGHNIFFTNYTGPWNPKDNQGNWSYKPNPTNRADLGAMIHDRNYDQLHITGASGLFTSSSAIGADYRLVGYELDLFASPNNLASPTEKIEGLIIGVGIGIFALPKTIVQGFKNAVPGYK